MEKSIIICLKSQVRQNTNNNHDTNSNFILLFSDFVLIFILIISLTIITILTTIIITTTTAVTIKPASTATRVSTIIITILTTIIINFTTAVIIKLTSTATCLSTTIITTLTTIIIATTTAVTIKSTSTAKSVSTTIITTITTFSLSGMNDYNEALACSKNFYSVVLDGVTDFLDNKFFFKWEFPFSDDHMESTYGIQFRQIMNSVWCRAEHITSFLLIYYGQMIDSTQVLDHVDSLNGSAYTYEYTVCLHLQMVPESLLNVLNSLVIRQAIDMNSRASIDNKTKLVMNNSMKDALKVYKAEVNK